MKFLLLGFCLFLAIFFEVGIIQLPFLLIALTILCIVKKSEWIFPISIVFGIILDSLSFRIIGESSVFFVLLLGLIFLYQKRFEIKTIQFVFISTSVGSFLYLLLVGSQNILIQSLVSGVIGGLIFSIVMRRIKIKEIV